MAHFITSSAKGPSKTKVTTNPAQADWSEWISGQITMEKAGKVWVEESFNLPVFPGAILLSAANSEKEEVLKKWMEEGKWSVCTYPEAEAETKVPIQRAAEFIVTATVPLSFNAFTGAPYWRISFESTSAEESKVNAVYARAYERGRI